MSRCANACLRSKKTRGPTLRRNSWCALSLSLTESRGPEAVQRAQAQLVSALVRLVMASVKAKVPVDVVVQCLA